MSRFLLVARHALALATLLALGPGAVEIHGYADRHQGAASDGPVFACDLDHGRATHVEAARRVERHDCAACLHRLHSRGGAVGAVACATLAAAVGSLPGIASAAPPFPPLAHAPSRGPPLV